jgi:molybdopterin adenylyltransferase
MRTIRFAILTVSDRASRGQRADASGPALVELVESKGYQVAKLDIVPDVAGAIEKKLMAWSDDDEADIILTTGGTGVAPRDVTPEATRDVVERLTPGLDEVMRAASLKITPHAMLSRAISGIRKRTLIINLPGSPKGAVENAQVVLPVLEHAVKLLRDEDAGH